LKHKKKDYFHQAIQHWILHCLEFENFKTHIQFFTPNAIDVLVEIKIYETFYRGNFVRASMAE
jgi:hypothetical protein